MRNFFARLLYAVGLCPVSQREAVERDLFEAADTIGRQADAIALVAAENGRLNRDLKAVWATIDEKAVKRSEDRVLAFQKNLEVFVERYHATRLRVVPADVGERGYLAVHTPFQVEAKWEEGKDVPMPPPPVKIPLKWFGVRFSVGLPPDTAPEMVARDLGEQAAAVVRAEVLKAWAAQSLLAPRSDKR